MSAWSAVLAKPTRAPAILPWPAGRLGGRCLVLFLVLNFLPVSFSLPLVVETAAGPVWANLAGRRARRKEVWSGSRRQILYSSLRVFSSLDWPAEQGYRVWKEEVDSAGKKTAGDHANQGKVDGRCSLVWKVRGRSLTAAARTVPRRCSSPDSLSSFQGY